MLGYPPVLRGLLALAFAGVSFPLAGILVLRMNLITMRFALMHGALLGGAIGLALGIHPLIATIAVNGVMVALIGRLARQERAELGAVTTMIMVVAVALAAAVSYRFSVPAKDSLVILWGDVFALRPFDLVITGVFSVAVILVVVIAHRPLIAVLYDREVAVVSGVNESFAYYAVLFGVATTIAVAMRLLGALLLDVLVILPALIALRLATSARATFLIASVVGFAAAVGGFFLSLWIDIPASTGVAIVGVAVLAVSMGSQYIRFHLVRRRGVSS